MEKPKDIMADLREVRIIELDGGFINCETGKRYM